MGVFHTGKGERFNLLIFTSEAEAQIVEKK